jgi:drug/metabolite transporter (DMT)-like permease
MTKSQDFTQRLDPVALTAFAAVVLIGGTNFVAVRFSNQELAPFWGAGLRFGAAALLLFAITGIWRLSLPRGKALLGALQLGVLNVAAFYALAYWGLVAAPAAFASVLVALAPVLTLLLASLHGLERLSWRGIGAAALALIGVGVVFADQLNAAIPIASALALAAAALCLAESTVLAKYFPRVHPIPTNAVAMLPGAVLLVALSAVGGEAWAVPTRPATWLSLGYLVTLGSVGLFVGFLVVLHRWTASATSYATVLLPLVTVAMGALLAGELVSVTFLLGAGLVMAGVYLGAIKSAKS